MMAVTTGNDYDHITIQNGSNTVLHYFKDNIFRGWANGTESINYMTVNSCTPNSQKTFKLYIDDEGSLIVRKGDNWFDVDYYDGEELLHTEEIWTSGQNATWNETPADKEDEYFTYTFLGWATDESPETVNANAQNNITSDRNLHAVWEKTGKTVAVYFYQNSTDSPTYTLETQNGTSLYDAIADMSWKNRISALYDITGIDLSNYSSVNDIDGTLIYDNNGSSILSSEEGQTALRNTTIMGDTVYRMEFILS